MLLIHLFENIEWSSLILIGIMAFVAGFIDAVVGGGGLIQIPALLINLPHQSLPTLLGTNKIAGLSGTSVAAYQYSKQVTFNYPLLLLIALSAFITSFLGAKAVVFINTDTLKPVVLIILIIIAVYTYIKKDLGRVQKKTLPLKKQMAYGSLIGAIVGFYDGFFGPGTGSFLVLGFVVILGFEFIQASAYSKVINCITNVSALIVFMRAGNYILDLAVLMAVFNILGNVIGSKMAMKRGNGFIRIVFLIIVTLLIVRYAYDIYTL